MDYLKKIRKIFVKHTRSQKLEMTLDTAYSKELNRVSIKCAIDGMYCITAVDLHGFSKHKNMLQLAVTDILDESCELFEEFIGNKVKAERN